MKDKGSHIFSLDPKAFTSGVFNMWHQTLIVLAIIATSCAAEISSSYALLEKNSSFKPDLKTEPIEQQSVFKNDAKVEHERHPVYKAEERRARIEPVRPTGPVIKHDMLADQPSTEVNRVDNLAVPNYGYGPGAPVEVAYPDIPYAPGYGYDPGYAPNGYDVYGNSHGNYLIESDPTIFGLLWSQVPDARTIVNFTGRTIVWLINSFLVLTVGSFLTVAVCSYTNLCSFTFHGVGPIHEEMRSLVTPERLEKISSAADFVKNAIDKYQQIQKVTDVDRKRERRGVLREF